MRRSVLFWLIVLLVMAGKAPIGQQFGPSTGSLVIAGGAVRDPAILAKFFRTGWRFGRADCRHSHGGRR